LCYWFPHFHKSKRRVLVGHAPLLVSDKQFVRKRGPFIDAPTRRSDLN
jgi:hypothetical protein